MREPQVLLLDEPLSNLDAKLRERMRVELRELQRRLRITTLYVTHDQIEALSMSNQIAVMNAGVIVQEGGPRDIYLQPKSKFVANFIGSTNQMPGQISKLNSDGSGRGSDRRRRELNCESLAASEWALRWWWSFGRRAYPAPKQTDRMRQYSRRQDRRRDVSR